MHSGVFYMVAMSGNWYLHVELFVSVYEQWNMRFSLV